MARASGSRWQPSYVTESSLGVPSGTEFKKTRLLLASGLEQRRSNLQSQQAVGDRSVAPGRLGNKTNTFRANGELSYGTFEDFIASACMNSWVDAGTAISALSVTVDAGTTNTMAATGIGGTGASLISVGDYVKVSGFASGYTANNGFFKVTARTDNVLTFGEAKDPEAGASLLADATAQANITVQRMGYLITGSTEKSLAFEDAQLDTATPIYFEALGCVANGMTLSMATDGIVTCNFDFIAKKILGPSGTKYAGSYADPSTTLPIRATDCVVVIDAAPVATITQLNLAMANQRSPQFSIGLDEATGISYGRSNLTGNLSLYVESSSFWTKYAAETRFALGLRFMDSSGTTGYALDVPRVFITDAQFQKSETDVIQNIPFQVEKDPTSGLINWRWWKLA